MKLVSPVLFLLSQVKQSSVKQDYTPGPSGPPALSVLDVSLLQHT